MASLTEEERIRYKRHILLPNVGEEGQQKIKDGKVLIVGAGGLGSPVALYLAAAGVGTIGLIDGDVVDLTNLQRQVIHSTPNIDKPKVESAKERMLELNPDINVVTYHTFLCADNAADIINPYDFVIDATDSFAVKFLINDACVLAGKPFSHGAIQNFEGQTLTYVPGSACYRCLFKEPPTTERGLKGEKAGVFGAIPGMMGTIQAAEALKYLTGVGELLTNKYLTFDALTMSFFKMKLNRDCNCPLCGDHPTITKLIDY